MLKIQKEGKWVPHELTETNIENRLQFIVYTAPTIAFFWHQIINCDEKWIYYDNSKRKKLWVDTDRAINISSKTKHS